MTMTQIIQLTNNAAALPIGNMSGHSTEAEALAVAKARGQEHVYKLANQATWLVANDAPIIGAVYTPSGQALVDIAGFVNPDWSAK